MPARRDKTTGLPLPSPVVPPDTVCFQIQVPNALEYRTALKGILSDLGRAWTWQQTIGQDNEDAHTAAEIWRAAIAQSVFIEDCGEGMSCIDVANCIESNPDTQAALAATIASSSSIQQIINQYSEKGVPMTPTIRNTVVTGNTECDLNSVFGSVTAIIDALDTNNRDFIEIIQITDVQAKKISKAISAVPLLGLLPVDELVSFVGDTAPALKTAYESAYTTEYRDTLRCALFCAARDKPDCQLTFQDIIEIFNARIGTALEPINFFVELMAFVVAGTWPGTVAIDVLTLIQLAAWQQGSEWMGVTLRTLTTVGLLGANDNDPDWEILCTDCPATWCIDIDFTMTDGSEYGVTPNIDVPGITFTGFTWIDGVGLVNSGLTDGDRTFGQINFPEPVTITGATLKWEYVDPPTSGNVWMDQDFGSAHPVSPPTAFFQATPAAPVTRYVFGGDKPGADVSPFIIITGLTLAGPNPIPAQFGVSNC